MRQRWGLQAWGNGWMVGYKVKVREGELSPLEHVGIRRFVLPTSVLDQQHQFYVEKCLPSFIPATELSLMHANDIVGAMPSLFFCKPLTHHCHLHFNFRPPPCIDWGISSLAST